MITQELVDGIREWLGAEGVAHFRSIKERHGRIDAAWKDGDIPHCVHFREGMSVRNKMRELTNYSGTAHEYDDNWVEVVERAISEQE